MNTFYEHHHDSIRFAYRCFDRILINGLIQPFQQPERVVGFFTTYRQLYPVSKPVLKDIATQYQRWVTTHAKAWRAPIVEAPAGRRDAFVDPYFRRAKPDQVVVIVKGREPARILTAIGKDGSLASPVRATVGRPVQLLSARRASGAGCSCGCAPIFRSRPASASTSITGWPRGCARRGSAFARNPMRS